MDSAKGSSIEKKITAKKTDVKNMEIGSINGEQEKVIDELEKVLSFLKSVHIRNEESLVYTKKAMGDLQSSLKFLPTGPSFNDVLPTDVKQNIFSFLCDSNAFVVASVCQEWREVLESRFKGSKVDIGKCDRYCRKDNCDCEDNENVEPEEMLKAAATHRMDAHLVLRYPVTEVDSKLLIDVLTCVSKFTIDGNYYDGDHDDSFYSVDKSTILSNDQFEDLMESLEKGNKIMEEVEILKLDLNNLNQERLSSCLVTRVKKLTLDTGGYGGMLDAKMFVNVLQKGSIDMNLSHLTLHFFCDFPDSHDESFDLADALCKVKNVRLDPQFDIENYDYKMLKLLVKNVITYTRPIAMKTLIVERFIKYGPLISPVDLGNLFRKMPTLQLLGSFTENQLEAIKSLPDLTVIESLPDPDHLYSKYHQRQNESGVLITKGSNEIF